MTSSDSGAYTTPTCRRVEFEVPQEVVGLLEGGSDGEDLMDEVFHADDAVLACNAKH